jgi:mono/diheme cytochrome c family protein
MKFLAAIGVLAILAALGSALYFYGGFYSVAAIEPHFDVVAAAVTAVREASIERHANAGTPPALDDVAVRAGAHAFAKAGCVDCHGAPGVAPAPFTKGMNPPPPALKEAGEEDAPGQIFWVVRNGIKMTGMPGFDATHADDKELWRIVAFIKKLPTVSPEEFGAWSADAIAAN